MFCLSFSTLLFCGFIIVTKRTLLPLRPLEKTREDIKEYKRRHLHIIENNNLLLKILNSGSSFLFAQSLSPVYLRRLNVPSRYLAVGPGVTKTTVVR